MAKKRNSADKIDEISQDVCASELKQSKCKNLEQAARTVGVTQETLTRWREEINLHTAIFADRQKKLEQENTRLKEIIAKQKIEIDLLKTAVLAPE